MRYRQFLVLSASLFLAFVTCAQGFATLKASARPLTPATVGGGTAKKRAAAGFGALSPVFEPNRGQVADARVRFISRNKGYTLFLTADGAEMSLRSRPGDAKGGASVKMKLGGAERPAQAFGEEELAGKVNYIRGRDPRSWVKGVETYGRVRYQGVYEGVDLVYYGSGGQVEYDFVVAPGADPRRINFTLAGGRVALESAGDLVVRTRAGALTFQKPFLYQEVEGVRKAVQGGYVLRRDGTVRFRVGTYDRTKPLVIDPVLSYASFFGGEFDNYYETDIAVDAQGSAYVVGYTNSSHEFPTTAGAFRPTDPELDGETFVAKLAPDGSSFVYSTFIGGAYARSIALDAAGNAYLTGIAGKDFPVRDGFQTQPGEPANGQELVDAFVAKLNADGSDLLYSSFVGGNDGDFGYAVAADAQGNAYISGETLSANFPVTPGAARANGNGINDSFVTKINTNAKGAASLVYSTYADVGRALAVDSEGNAYAAGNEVVTGKQSVVKLNPAGTAFVYDFGVSGDAQDQSARALWYVKDIAVDAAGRAYVTGSTPAASSAAFPKAGGFQTAFGGGQLDAFLARLDSSGTSVTYATYLGGAGNEVGRGVSVDAAGVAHVTGNTTSQDFPLRDALQPRHNGGFPDSQDRVTAETGGPTDAFVSKINTAAAGAASLVFSTFYGFGRNETGNSVATDAQGSAYVLCGQSPFGIPGIIHTPRPTEQRALAERQSAGLKYFDGAGHFVVKIAAGAASTIQFGEPSFSVGEAGRSARVTVTRKGDTAGPAGVEYFTLDGTASGRSDYTSTLGTLRFAAGESAKTFDVLVSDDAIDEADETLGLVLVNPSPGSALGPPLSAALNITDNDSGAAAPNPLDDSQFFVRQHYLDFLGREPDDDGFRFWTGVIESCGADAQCREVNRINVSAAFFLSIEFQETTFYAVRVQRVAFGRRSDDPAGRMRYGEFIRAARRVGEGVIIGEAGAGARLEVNKQAYAESVASDPAFVKNFPATLGAAQYVGALFASAGVAPTEEERRAAVEAFGAGGFAGRVAALRSAADSATVRASEKDTGFVLLQYLGYLRRDPDARGYEHWLAKLLEHRGNFVSAEMVKAFITSDEYRRRFGL